MASTEERNREAVAEAYYAGLDDYAVGPLWKQLGTLLPKNPKSKAVPHVWRYAELRPLLLQASDVVTAEEAERRVLMMLNPGLKPKIGAVTNIFAGLQLIMPGEVAGAHHHAAAALRVIVEGSGAFTAVDGERTRMEPGDFVLTPSWTWHDHGNETDEPMIWLDGLDIPLINALEANMFGGSLEGAQAEVRPADATTRMYAARLNPAWVKWEKPFSPVISYPWTQTEKLLADALADGWDGSPYDGLIFEYSNPFTGGPALPTLGGYVQLLKPGLHTEAHWHTTSAVYHVIRGEGRTIVDGVELDWVERDTFAVPAWAVHEHVNSSSADPAILFSVTDDPPIRALGFYREQATERQA